MIGIFRHANALASSDEMARPLSDEGIDQAKEMSKRFSTQWEILLCSEAVRTQQTGVILSDLPPQVMTDLYVNHEPDEAYLKHLVSEIRTISQNKNTLVVTHQPLICPLAAAFLAQDEMVMNVSSGEGIVINTSTLEYTWFKRQG
ncbi:MAG: phosphoglycerate mutase family protein [Pseudomonadota bacterium]|nr:phosphoglycerate mutase family protein [Pseudomonadota bacterium]